MISRVFYALPLLAFGQDVQLSMAAVRPLDLPFATRLVVYHLERERFNAKARERSGSRQSGWQQCESCERRLGGTHLRRLRVFRGDHWHRHRGRRRRGGRRMSPDVRL